MIAEASHRLAEDSWSSSLTHDFITVLQNNTEDFYLRRRLLIRKVDLLTMSSEMRFLFNISLNRLVRGRDKIQTSCHFKNCDFKFLVVYMYLGVEL